MTFYKRKLFTFFCIYFPSLLIAQDIPVFTSGQDGYNTFRIPAIIQAGENTLLAFCEGRKNNAADFGDIDIVMKKSKDGGNSWSSLQIIVDYAGLQAGNPAPVIDFFDPLYPNGRIFLFYNTGDNHEREIARGKGIRECWYITSIDQGTSWSEPVNITLQVHKPRQPAYNAAYNFQEDWRTYANTPGHAIQFPTGTFKGRMYIPANHSSGNPKPDASHYTAHAYYTDDHGKSFWLADNLPVPGSNEATAAWLPDSRLYFNARNQRGNIHARIVAFSSNGGQQWDTVYIDKQLPDPVCEGSVLNIRKGKKRMLLAFCNPADTLNRQNLVIKLSKNNGITWYRQLPVNSNRSNDAVKKDIAAYSDLVQTGKHTIGVLYEKNQYSQIVYKSIRF